MTIKDIKLNDIGLKSLISLMIFVPIFFSANIWLGHATIRVSQEAAFQLGALLLYALVLLENIYLSVFLILSVVLYLLHNFCGGNYLTNLFYGCIIYQTAYHVSNSENFEKVFKAMLWFCFLNLLLMIPQCLGYDPIFFDMSQPKLVMSNIGFMGLQCFMGILFVLALPIMLYFNKWAALLFIIPIYLSHSSICVAAYAVIIGLYFLWNSYASKKIILIISLITLFVGAGVYIRHDSGDNMMTNRFNIWKLVLVDAFKEPIVGWGMDAFRNITADGKKDFNYFTNEKNLAFHGVYIPEKKQFMYPKGAVVINNKMYPWDNPHNEFIGLLFEFGVFGVLILIAFAADIFKRFSVYDGRQQAFFLFFIGFSICATAQFPMHVARLAIFLPIMLGIYYKLTDEDLQRELPNG